MNSGKLPKVLSLLLLFATVLISSVNSQEIVIPATPGDTTKILRIELTDGSVFVGYLLEKKEAEIVVSTSKAGIITIRNENISKIGLNSPSRRKPKEFWFPNPNPTRYNFAPTAIPLKKGSGYYQNFYLVLNMANVGITNNFSIGGGFEFISTFAGLSSGSFSPIIMLTPKISGQVAPNFYMGGGVMLIRTPGIFGRGNSDFMGIGYGVGTFGNENDNFTIGLGLPYLIGDDIYSPIIMFGGMIRGSEKFSVISENWIMTGQNSYAVFSYGARIFGEKISVDLGFINSKDIIEFIIVGIPYIGLVVSF